MIYPNETKNSVIFASLAMVAIIGISLVWLNVSVYGQTQDNKTLYNKDLNPRQVEYPAILGFNDLHIEAINHINPNMTSDHNSDVVKRIVHHHCKVYDDMTAACLLFPTGMGDQDKPYGIEYVITAQQYQELPEEEKNYWHYLKTVLPKVNATLPDLTPEEAVKLMPILNETYGKVVYFWQYGDKYPIGKPQVLIIRDITG